MRILLLFSLFLLFARFTAEGQTVTLRLRNEPMEKAFREITRQTDYQFVYTQEQLQKTGPVTLQVSRTPLAQALETLFKDQPLSFLIEEQHIVVKDRPLAAPNVAARKIRGAVMSETGEPVNGATIRVKNKTLMTISAADGSFELSGVASNDYLVVTSIGYHPEQVFVGEKNLLDIRLSIAVSALDETLIVAYGTTTRRLSTGNVAKVTSEEISKQPVSNPLSALQGRVAGLSILQTSGVAGSSFKVEIRGRSALDASLSQNDPLIIIDGVPFEPGNLPSNQLTSAANNPTAISQGGLSPLNTLAPADIESIEVLKDADATAIYGSRGGNGVILITTKKGKANQATVSANFSSGWSRVASNFRLLNTAEYVGMRREAFFNEGSSPTPTTAPDLYAWDTTRYTDLKKVLIGNTARYEAAQFSLHAGSLSTRLFLNGSYRRETSVFHPDFSDRVTSVRAMISHHSDNRRFFLQVSSGFSHDRNHLLPFDQTRHLGLPPHIRLYDSAGGLAWEEGGIPFSSVNDGFTNPLAELKKQYESNNSNLLNSLLSTYSPLPGLTLRISAGYNQFLTEEFSKNPNSSLNPHLGQFGSAQFAHSVQRNWIVEPQAEWAYRKGEHSMDVLAGSTFQNKWAKSEALFGSGYTNDLLLSNIAAAGLISATNSETQYRYTALFGRLQYHYKSRYLFSITGRRDGSSRFAPENRFASFGSLAGAWILSDEKWFSLPFVSFAKIRGSYGVTGNDQIGDYRYLNLWGTQNPPYNGTAGVVPRSLYNPNYYWEKNKKFEAAAEINFLKDRIQTSLVYYRNRSSNQLVNYTLPAQTGFFTVVQNLPALVENKGWEMTLSATPVRSQNLSWSTAFNLSFPTNKLIRFPGLAASSYASQYVEGKSLSTIYKLHYLGVDPTTGLYTFEDADKDGLWTEKDYQALGHLDPKLFGGFTNTVQYRALSFSFLVEFRKQKGINYLGQLKSNLPGTIYNQPDFVLNRWTTPGQHAAVQRFSSAPFGSAYTALSYLGISDGIYSDASYARLKNVSVSYSLKGAWLRKAKLSEARLYLQGQNLLTVTSYKGTDPETQNFYVLPPLRTIAAGIQLNF